MKGAGIVGKDAEFQFFLLFQLEGQDEFLVAIRGSKIAAGDFLLIKNNGSPLSRNVDPRQGPREIRPHFF